MAKVRMAKARMAGNDTPDDTDVNPKPRRRRLAAFVTLALACTMAAAMLACLSEVAFDALGAFGAENAPNVAGGAGDAASSAGTFGARLLYLAAASLLTAVVEEIVFRGILLNALMQAVKVNAAICVSAVVFGVLHALPIGVGDAVGQGAASSEAIAGVAFALILKFAQSTLFGIVMAGIVVRSDSLPKGLAIVVATHAAFDVVYFAVPVLATGGFPSTYAALSGGEFVGTLLSSALMAVPAAAAFHLPKRSEGSCT